MVWVVLWTGHHSRVQSHSETCWKVRTRRTRGKGIQGNEHFVCHIDGTDNGTSVVRVGSKKAQAKMPTT